LSASVRNASGNLRGVSDNSMPVALEKIRDQLEATEVSLWRGNGTLVATVGDDKYQLQPERPSASEWRQVRQQGVSWRSEGLDDNSPGHLRSPRSAGAASTATASGPGSGFGSLPRSRARPG
jgi:hypothetical protein